MNYIILHSYITITLLYQNLKEICRKAIAKLMILLILITMDWSQPLKEKYEKIGDCLHYKQGSYLLHFEIFRHQGLECRIENMWQVQSHKKL